MTIDLTNIGSNPQPQAPRGIQKHDVHTNEVLTVPQTEEAKEFRKSHWDITNSGGQVKAGEVDEKQTEFLKHTKFVA